VDRSEQALAGVAALELVDRAPLELAQADVERLRHLLWNGKYGKACQALSRIVRWMENAALLKSAVVAKVGRLVVHCTELRGDIANNQTMNAR